MSPKPRPTDHAGRTRMRSLDGYESTPDEAAAYESGISRRISNLRPSRPDTERWASAAFQKLYARWNQTKRDAPELLPSAAGCWCGEPCGHDWPGKSEKVPHPR